ncbi:hypothetical protein D3C86_2003510 [compost metagenome]
MARVMPLTTSSMRRGSRLPNAGEKERTVPVRVTVWAMMLWRSPPRMEPRVTTAESRGETLRETMVWSAPIT